MAINAKPPRRGFTTPFLYVIGWMNHDKWYLGVRYAKNCHPKDMWTCYFTSSKRVHEFADNNGPPDYIMTMEGPEEEVKSAEFKWQIEQRLFEDERWLNLKGGGKYFHFTAEGILKGTISGSRTRSQPGWSERHQKRVSESWSDPLIRERQTKSIRAVRLGSKHSEEAKDKMRAARLAKPIVWSKELRLAAAERARSRPLDQEQRRRIAEKLRGRPRPEYVKQKLRDAKLGKRMSQDQKNDRDNEKWAKFDEFLKFIEGVGVSSYSEWEAFKVKNKLPANIPKDIRFYVSRGVDTSWRKLRKDREQGVV